jgi:hypothetical protein
MTAQPAKMPLLTMLNNIHNDPLALASFFQKSGV